LYHEPAPRRAGRIRRGPAPLNLEVPEYRFISDDKLVLG
jgi:ubiquinol-cytochrome c reductase iron-sulfur subunit